MSNDHPVRPGGDRYDQAVIGREQHLKFTGAGR
jgi:hypothetical protein